MGANDRERRQSSVDRWSSKRLIHQLRCDVGNQPWSRYRLGTVATVTTGTSRWRLGISAGTEGSLPYGPSGTARAARKSNLLPLQLEDPSTIGSPPSRSRATFALVERLFPPSPSGGLVCSEYRGPLDNWEHSVGQRDSRERLTELLEPPATEPFS
jgi:hypothetical protein